MAKKDLKVILLEDIPDVGPAGTIATVSEGFARNNLFPEGKAAIATETTRKVQSEKQKKDQEKAAAAEKKIQELADQIDGTELIITARLKEGSTEDIYGSITARDIASELKNQANLNLKAKDIALRKPITTVGGNEVTVRLTKGIEAVIHVTIAANE